jgi:hypothetical protein
MQSSGAVHQRGQTIEKFIFHLSAIRNWEKISMPRTIQVDNHRPPLGTSKSPNANLHRWRQSRRESPNFYPPRLHALKNRDQFSNENEPFYGLTPSVR